MSKRINFGGLSASCASRANSEIAILPVPFDLTSSWVRGTDKGPAAIIDASTHMELYDIETDSEVYQRGIYTAPPLKPCKTASAMVRSVERSVGKLLDDNKFAVVLGGEHSVSVGAVAAHAERVKGLSVLHIDAHLDTRDSYEGSKYNHACTAARIREICPTVHAGIRSMDISERDGLDRKRTFFAHEIQTSRTWIQKAVSKLSSQVYITFDLDAFDPSIMSSVGTPEPGGLGWYQALDLLKAVTAKKDVVGFDIVELCPPAGNKASDFTAALLTYKLLSYVFERRFRHRRTSRGLERR